jgi:hypothetical protein
VQIIRVPHILFSLMELSYQKTQRDLALLTTGVCMLRFSLPVTYTDFCRDFLFISILSRNYAPTIVHNLAQLLGSTKDDQISDNLAYIGNHGHFSFRYLGDIRCVI